MLNKSKIQFIKLEIAKVYLPSKYNQILNKAKSKFINLEIANAKKGNNFYLAFGLIS